MTVLQDAHEHSVNDLVLTATNWDGIRWNKCNQLLANAWLKCNKGEHSAGWRSLKAKYFIRTQLIDPVCKEWAADEGMAHKWNARWPLHLRNEAALHIVASMTAEYEIGNLPISSAF